MQQIKSRRHYLKFYGTLIGSSIFFIVVGTFLGFDAYDEYINGTLIGKKQIWPLLSAVFLFMGPYTIYCYVRNSPSISLDQNTIAFNNEKYRLDDILSIEYTGKQNFKYFMVFKMEAMKITFKNSVDKIIFDDMYSNAHELKHYIECTINKRPLYKIQNLKHDISNEHFYFQKGNFILSYRGITAIITIGMFSFMTIKIPSLIGSFVLAITTLMFVFLFASLVNYFGINEHYFIVKNHIFFWRTKCYRHEDIREIVYETRSKVPNCLRIILLDYSTKLYPAGTLNDKHWKEMQSQLQEYSIQVRNECIF